jgi:hypothetical protein
LQVAEVAVAAACGELTSGAEDAQGADPTCMLGHKHSASIGIAFAEELCFTDDDVF